MAPPLLRFRNGERKLTNCPSKVKPQKKLNVTKISPFWDLPVTSHIPPSRRPRHDNAEIHRVVNILIETCGDHPVAFDNTRKVTVFPIIYFSRFFSAPAMVIGSI